VTLSTKKIILIQFALVALLAGSATAAEPIRVLFITGRNNHRWQLTTPSLKKTLEDSGRFKVDVTEKPAEITAKSLSGYDVIFNGWTGFPKKTGHLWGLDTEKAIDDFVAGGKGMASFHAGSSSFHDWVGFQKIIGGTWGRGTGHGRYHEFTVEMTDVDHPITKGGPAVFDYESEQYYMIVDPGINVLASTVYEYDGHKIVHPVMWTKTWGKGRIFYNALGHCADEFETFPEVHEMTVKGLIWAAEGKAIAE